MVSDLALETDIYFTNTISTLSNEFEELKSDYESAFIQKPTPSTSKAALIDRVAARLIQNGDRLFGFYDQWAESIRVGVTLSDPQKEAQIKTALEDWIKSHGLMLDMVTSLRVDNEEIKNATDLVIVSHKIRTVIDNWKTPNLYILPSMRRQVISGAGAENIKKFLEGSKNQRLA